MDTRLVEIRCAGFKESWPMISQLLNNAMAGQTPERKTEEIMKVLATVHTSRDDEVFGLINCLGLLHMDVQNPPVEYRKHFINLLGTLPKDPLDWHGQPCPKVLVAAFSEVLVGWSALTLPEDSEECFSTVCSTYQYWDAAVKKCSLNGYQEVLTKLKDAFYQHLKTNWKYPPALKKLPSWITKGGTPDELIRIMANHWFNNADCNTRIFFIGLLERELEKRNRKSSTKTIS